MKKLVASLALVALAMVPVSADEKQSKAFPASQSEGRAYRHFAQDLGDLQRARAELDELEKKLRSDFDSFLEDGAKLHGLALGPGEKPGYEPPSKDAPNGFFFPKRAPGSASAVALVGSDVAPIASK